MDGPGALRAVASPAQPAGAVPPGTRVALAARAGRPAPAGPNATIVEREDLTGSIARFRVEPDGPVPSFLPGQYLTMGVEVDGRDLVRPYSTASARGESSALEFLVRLVADGALTPRLWRLGPGHRVSLGRPKGLFTDDGSDDRRPVYIATGTGLAPLVSMLATRLDGHPDPSPDRRPVVVHGVAYEAELAYRDRLEAWARRGRIAYVPAISRPGDPANAGWSGATGRLDGLVGGLLDDLRLDARECVAWLCGSPGMVDGVRRTLLARGVTPEAVRSEVYWNPGPEVASSAA